MANEFVVRKGLIVSGSTNITGSVTASEGFTGSFTGPLFGSASFATTASYATVAQTLLGSVVSASYAATALSASYAPGSPSVSASYAETASYATVAQNVLGSITSASYAATASYVEGSETGGITGSFKGDGAQITGIVSASYAISASAATSITFVPSSAASASYGIGSGAVGFTISSSLNKITGSVSLANGATGSLQGSASYALTSSYATVAQNVLGSITSASYALTALSASYAPGNPSISASYAETASYATVAQNVLGSITSASYALTASYAEIAQNVLGSISSADTASYGRSQTGTGFTISGSLNKVTGSLVVSNSISSSFIYLPNVSANTSRGTLHSSPLNAQFQHAITLAASGGGVGATERPGGIHFNIVSSSVSGNFLGLAFQYSRWDDAYSGTLFPYAKIGQFVAGTSHAIDLGKEKSTDDLFWTDDNKFKNIYAYGIVSSSTFIGETSTITSGTIGFVSASMVRTQNLVELSSRRYKNDITPLLSQLSNIQLLEPVSFNWKGTNVPDIGLIAEDVEKIYPSLVEYDESHEIAGIKYSKMVPLLINVIKELSDRVDTLEARLNLHKDEN